MSAQSLNAATLAQEFDVPETLMAAFLDRFAPSRVAPNTYAAQSDTMLFIHIPKTAGVSVGRSFRGAFDQFRGVEWNDVARSFRETARHAIYSQTRNKQRQVIMGHFGWPEMQMWRNHEMPMKCGTIFRDPVARVISNYNYNCSAAHPDNEGFRNRFPTLDSYAERLPLDVQLTQAIGLIDSFETALTKLIRHYTFLGVTEHLPASLSHLAKSHGLSNLREYRENVGMIRPDRDSSSKLAKLISGRSHNDIRIHRLVSRLYGS